MEEKDSIELRLQRLINREVKIVLKIKHSSHHVEDFAGKSGILRSFDIGEDYEDIIALVEFVVVTGKKREGRSNEQIWLDARDIAGIIGKGVKDEID